MSPFSSFPTEDSVVEKQDGQKVGPYSMIFAGKTIMVKEEMADIDEGDVIIRKMPNGKEKFLTVIESNYFGAMGGLKAHHQIKYKEGRMTDTTKPSQTINIHSPQAVQIGDHNTQQITATIQMLVQRIEESDTSPENKDEAKSLLQKFLAHPLVSSIIGASIGLGGG